MAPSPTAIDRPEALRAFARLYGYVRFFHPSDAAADADWDALAIEGVRACVAVSDAPALASVLQSFVDPIAPTVQIYTDAARPPVMDLSGEGAAVAWQHRGYGFGTTRSIYESGRTERPRVVATGRDWAPLTRSIDAKPYRGKTIRLRARARVQAHHRRDAAALWLRVDLSDDAHAFFDNMADRLIRAGHWTEYAIEGPVAGDATKIVFGGIAYGGGAVFFDDFAIDVLEPDGTATPIAFDNPGFETPQPTSGWNTNAPGFGFYVIADADAGSKVLQMQRRTTILNDALFDERPAAGEVLHASLGRGLFVALPVALPSSIAKRGSGQASDPRAELPGAEDPAVRIAAVIVAWNVLHHFYPYFDVIDENWDVVLDDVIDDVLDDHDAADLHDTLERLVARLHDGHGRVSGPIPLRGRLPLSLLRVDGKVVVLAAASETGLSPGDEVVALDGDPIAGWVQDAATRVSGSPQWIEHRVLENAEVSLGPLGSSVRVTAERLTPSGAQRIDVALTRGTTPPPRAFHHAAIERFADGVYYVDLDRASWPEIESNLPALAKAPGVVFDLRGYPNSNHQILAHLLTEPDSARWMFVPQLIYPRDDPDPSHRLLWYEIGWDLAPQAPHLSGRIAFITGPGAISYAESVLGYVQGYELGAIVGAATAGANGNVNPIALPGGFSITWTGMKVTRFDGSPHHVVGIAPTIPAAPTRAGITAGIDEVREIALAHVRP